MEPSPPRSWSLASRIAFRFASLFFCFFVLPVDFLIEPIVIWFGETVLGMEEVERFFSGSGDQSYYWARLALVTLVALVGTAVWSVLDRRREHYRGVFWYFSFLLRGYLGVMMIIYGVAKFGGQFQAPELDTLTKEIGELSPMGLAWLFMGYSAAYSAFAGVLEILGGLLLAHRRTTLPGALIILGVMTNVVAMNFCFDIPVKINSMFYGLIALALTVPHWPRLWTFFFTRRSTPPFDEGSPHDRLVSIILDSVFGGVFGVIIFVVIFGVVFSRLWYQAQNPENPIPGSFEISKVEIDSSPRAMALNQPLVWRRIHFHYSGRIIIERMSGKRFNYLIEFDEENSTLTLTGRKEKKFGQLQYEITEEGEIRLEGTYREKEIKMEGQPITREETRLISRGFHWINEYPLQ